LVTGNLKKNTIGRVISMKKTGSLILSLVFIFVIVLTGCSKTSSTDVASPAVKDNASSAPTASTASPMPDQKLKYAVVLKTLANPFWVDMKTGIVAEAKKQGVTVDVFAASDESDLQGQAKIFEDLLGKGYAGIAFAPLSPVSLIPSVVAANKKGIFVVNIDEKVDMTELKNAGGFVYNFITTDNVKVGEKAGKSIVDKLGAAGGKVAILEGKAGNASGADRKNGAANAFKAASSIKVVDSQPADWDRTKALDVATNILQKNPDLKAFYAANDTMALGAMQAVANAGLDGKVLVVGTDGDPEALQAVAAGKMFATVAQDPGQIGASALDKLIKLAKDKPAGSVDMQPEFVAVDSKLIVK
jgi:D-allose transport system substrate-binding protein